MKKVPLRLPGKRVLISVTALTLTAAIGAGIFLSRGSGESVPVYPFDYVGMTEFWGDSQESYGPVSTDKIQTVFLTETQTVTEILVKEGDEVKKGDVLMTFDTSLDSISLERKSLKVEKLKLQLKDAQHQLEELKDMLPSDPVVPTPPKEEESDLGAELKSDFQISNNKEYDGSAVTKPLICWIHDLADIDNALLEKLRLQAETLQAENQEEEDDKPSNASEIPIFEVTEESQEPNPSEESKEPDPPEESKEPDPSEESKEPDPSEETTDPTEGTEDTAPTEPDDQETGFYVIFKVTDKNMSKGQLMVWQGMHIVGDRTSGFGFRFFDASLIEDYTLPKEEVKEELPSFDIGISYTTQQLSQMRQEARKKIKELEFNIRMAEAEYKIMQTELSDGNVYAEIDGAVVSLLTEEEARAAMQPLIKVSGGGGFFVEGSVSELEKDKLQLGQEVTINDWNTGMTYTGEVRSIGDFPSGDDNWNGVGNPNATYYPFRVFISGEADLRADQHVSVMYSTAGSEHGVYVENPFIRTEDGRSFVFVRGEQDKLEKRYVTVGKSLWGSYKEILNGLQETDFLAFPYGKDVKEGAPTVEGDISTLYGY